MRDGRKSAGALARLAGYAPCALQRKSPMPADKTTDFEPRPRDFHARLRRGVAGVGARQRHRHRGRRAAALLAAVAVPAFAAPQDWRTFEIGNAEAAETVVEPMPFEQGGQSFPGSAFYYLASEAPVPLAGEGAPALDSGAHWDNDDSVGPVARSLRATGNSTDYARALTCLTQAIYYEAASEADAGQRAVAQVVLNRVAHPAYPGTVCGVVYQGSERTTGCQFTFTCDGALARVPSRLFWLRAEAVARAALAGYVYAPVGLATHYHTIAVHPYWADSLNYLGTIGAHRFYRLGGRAGSPTLFNTAAYRGGEPVAAPHPRTAAANTDPGLDPLAIERAYAQGFGIAVTASGAETAPVRPAPAPTYAAALQARGGDALYTARSLPEAHGIRPEYANSGQWIARPGS